MVPHRKILRAIALVSYYATDTVATREALTKQHQVKFPSAPGEFWEREIMHWISPELQALFMTTDSSLTGDFRPMMMAANDLEIGEYLHITHRGPDINVSEAILKWRTHATIRVALETMFLCGIDVPTIMEDLRRMYGYTVDEADLRRFADLYADREFALGDNWLGYTSCIGQNEAVFKMRLMQQPREYVRWKLGAPVTLDADSVLDRMMSDAHFTCQLLKSETDNQLSRDDLVRVKLERDTIFKCMDRKIKFKEASNGAGTNKAVDAIQSILLHYTDEMPPLKEEILQQPPDLPPAPPA